MKYKVTISLYVVFFSLSVFASPLEIGTVLQEDLYIEKNNCGMSRESRHSVIQISLPIEKKIVSQNLIINFKEKIQGSNQTILYDQKTLFYPGLFGHPGHHEYTLPECIDKSSRCIFNFYIFKNKTLSEMSDIHYDLSISKATRPYPLINLITGNIKNNNVDSSDYFFKNLFIRHVDKTFVINLDNTLVKKLINKGFNLEISAIWRSNKSQIEYSDQAIELNRDLAWVKSGANEIIMSYKDHSPSYLAAMIIARKDNRAYETKIVVKDENNIFYSSCKK